MANIDLNIDKFRLIRCKNKVTDVNSYLRDDVRNQAIREFDLYQLSLPNTHKIYVNDSETPILATFQDVSDLEVRADTKWVLTSVANKLNAGDIFTWCNRKWLVVYDKQENAGDCYVVKAQPCTFMCKFPYKKSDGTYSIYEADTILMTYLTDTKDFKQPFPTEVGTTFISVQYNDITINVKSGDRIWIFNSAFQITGVDVTNIDHYLRKGFLKWTLRPCDKRSDMDNEELGVCDYYKYFPKENTTPTIPTPSPTQNLGLFIEKNKLKRKEFTYVDTFIKDDVSYSFVGGNCGCRLFKENGNRYKLITGNETGIIKVKATLKSNNTKHETVRIIIE